MIVSAHNPENIGQLVEVLSPSDGKPFRLPRVGFQWRVRCAGGVFGLLYDYPDGRVVTLCEGPVPDACLRPLRGQEAPPALVDLAVEALKVMEGLEQAR